MTLIWAHAMDASLFSDSLDCNKVDSSACAVFGGSYDSFSFAWFWITYSISALTGSFGITKLLMIGPCPMLTDDGRLGGILTHFLAVAFSMGSKATFLGVFIGFVDEDNLVIPIMVFYLLTIAPNIILSLISIAGSTGCNKTFFRMILDYPAIWLLPAATFFVVGPENRTLRKKLCCKQRGERSLLGVSSKLTFLNIILTLVMYIIAAVIEVGVDLDGNFYLVQLLVTFPCFIIAIFFTCLCFRCCHYKCCCCIQAVSYAAVQVSGMFKTTNIPRNFH